MESDRAMTDSPTSKLFWSRIDRAESVDELRAVLQEVERAKKSLHLTSRDASDLFEAALNTMRLLTKDRIDIAKDLIHDILIPICLKSSGSDFGEFNGREMLAEWIDQYPPSATDDLRLDVISFLCARLDSDPSKAIMWTISAIGFRTPEVESALWRCAMRDDAIGDAAIGTIASVGVPQHSRIEFGRSIVAKSLLSSNWGPIYALQEAGTVSEIEVVLAILGQLRTNSDGTKSHWRAILSRVAGNIASQVPDETDFQNRLWIAMRPFKGDVLLSSEGSAQFNSELAVLDHIDWLIESNMEIEAKTGMTRRYIAYDRLTNLIRPQHLVGWDRIERPEFRRLIKQDACFDTKLQGNYTTTEVRIKKLAWQIGLMCRLGDVGQWIEEAVFGESNRHVRHEILEIAAVVRLDPIPTPFLSLIQDEFDSTDADTHGEMFSRMGAIQLARSSGTRQAFEALLRFGLTSGGSVLLSTCRAIADLARARIKAGDRDVIEMMFALLGSDCPKKNREAILEAISYLAVNRLIEDRYIDVLFEVATGDKFDERARGNAVEAIGYLGVDCVATYRQQLVALAVANDELSWRAMEVLARNGWLAIRQSATLAARLGLVCEGVAIRVAEHATFDGWQVFIIGMLYQCSPSEYSTAVAGILERADANAVYQILDTIQSHERATPQVVVEAVIDRMNRTWRRSSVETIWFEVLARIAPERLIQEGEKAKWKPLLLEGRVAFCEAISAAAQRLPEVSARASIALLTFVFDSAFAVRRSVFRAIARIDPEFLLSICRQWSQAAEIDFRKLVPEAIEWIPDHILSDSELEKWELSSDPEPKVRRAADGLLDRRYRHKWADAYLQRLISTSESDSGISPVAYRYGRALVQFGDDETCRKLRQYTSSNILPANIDYWLSKLEKDIAGEWKRATEKWEEPISTERGTIEKVVAKINWGPELVLAAELLLWKRNRKGPSDLGDWGGVAEVQAEGRLAFFNVPDETTVEIEGRCSFHAQINRYFTIGGGAKTRIIFRSNDAYPEDPLDSRVGY